MNARAVLAAAALFLLPLQAAEVPASIRNGRVESGSGLSPAKALDTVGRQKTPEWVGWSVKAIPAACEACCFSNNFKVRGCTLSDTETSWGTSDSFEPVGGTNVFVFIQVKEGRPSLVRVASEGCPINGADRRIVWLGPVEPAASLAALSGLLDATGRGVADSALAAVAFHADASADSLLEKRAFDRSLPEESRKQAIFWAGNARGQAGYRLLDRVLTSEPDGDLRQHAVFALTQSSVEGAPERIKRVAIDDRDNDVRAQALFWLAQTNAEGAGAWILGRLDTESDDHVREQAVLALSQLKDGTDWLLKVLRSKRDPQTVRRALFWLGQSNDPRALEEIEKILDKAPI